MTGTKPLVIVGGGIVGVSLAYHLRDAKRQVRLFEAETLGSGTTSESIANLGLNYPSPRPMRRYSRDHYFSLVDSGHIGYERTGGLVIETSPAGISDLESTAEDLANLGHETSILTPPDVREFGIDPPEGSRTLHIPDKGYLDPSEVIDHWANRARSAGVSIETGTQVRDVHVEDGRVSGVETADCTVDAGIVVNATGQWAPGVNALADVTLPLRHNYGPILVLEADRPVTFPYVYFSTGQYIRPEGRRTFFAGRRGARYRDAERRNPEHARSVPESFYLDVDAVIEKSLPAVESPRVINEWKGMRTITPDGRPIVGETTVEGFYAACGLSGEGITLAPAIGRDLATLITTGERTPALEQFDPDRFEETVAEYTGRRN